MKLKQSIAFFLCLHQGIVHPTTFVYNLRIAESTRYPIEKLQGPFLTSVTAADQHRLRYDDTTENAGGLLGVFIYTRPHFYIRADAAVAHERDTFFTGRQRSRVQTDDLLITFGSPFSISKRSRCTLSGLMGIPTHKDKNFVQSQFGICHFSLGIQLDGGFTYSLREDDTLHNAVQGAVRFLHFFPRTTPIPLSPLLTKCFNFTIGNVLDILINHRTQYGKHGFEFGYNPTLLLGATIEPELPAVTNQLKGTRSSLYGTYSYLTPIREKPHGFGVGFSYGFDHDSCPLNLKRAFTAWLSWGMNF